MRAYSSRQRLKKEIRKEDTNGKQKVDKKTT